MKRDTLIARVRGLLLAPRSEWPRAAAEPATTRGLYTGYIALLAAIPPVFAFIRSSLIGYRNADVHVRVPPGPGLAAMLLRYLLGLLLVYVMALVIDALATGFGGRHSRVQALKAIAYAWTASWIAGAFVIVPWLGGPIMLAGGLYAIYLLYLGLPLTMRCPPEKSAGYTAVSVIVALVLFWICGAIVSGLVGANAMWHDRAMHAGMVDADHARSTEHDRAWRERMETAGRKLKAAQAAGDAEAQKAALASMMAGTDRNVQAVDPERLRAMLPKTLDDRRRTSVSAQRQSTMGLQVSQARAHYVDARGRAIDLEVVDTGGARGFLAMTGALAPATEHEGGADILVKTWRDDDGRVVHERWDDRASDGAYSVIVADRFAVSASGRADDPGVLKDAVESVDLDDLEDLKDAGRP